MVTKRPFGSLNGQDVPLLTITDGAVSVELLPFGAALRSIWVPDKDGISRDICLGYDNLEQYRTLNDCLGGLVGRFANRIGGARFSIDGTEYHVTASQAPNCLHGGAEGFHKKLWNYGCGENSVTFSLDSPDGQEGFPGNLHIDVTYTLQDGTLSLEYLAACDKDTVVNLTNHAYFNLAGQDGGQVGDHILTVRASRYTPSRSDGVPTGEIAHVDGTPLDFRIPTALGKRMGDPFLASTRGYDHNLVLDGGDGPAAKLYCPRTGIALEMTTTMEGMQLYTASCLPDQAGKNGVIYQAGCGVCLETQRFPDAINHDQFPTPILRAGKTYREETTFHFFGNCR